MGIAPCYKISAEDKDITNLIAERLISLSITDEEGFKNDTLKIDITDDGVAIPRKGAKLAVSLGYDEKYDDMGFFIVDEVELRGPPDAMTISAKGAPFDKNSKQYGTLQNSKNRSWDKQNFKNILEKIAGEHKLKPAITKAIGDIVVPHIIQSAESDMHFLTRLAKKYDALFKVSAGNLIIKKKGNGLSVSGKALPIITVLKEECSQWNYKTESATEYKKVTATYRDTKTGTDKQVSAGNDEPVKKLREIYKDEETAKEAVNAALKRYARGTVSIEITTVGNTVIRAGLPVILKDFRDGVNGRYIIKNANHDISPSGYSTKFTAEREVV